MGSSTQISRRALQRGLKTATLAATTTAATLIPAVAGMRICIVWIHVAISGTNASNAFAIKETNAGGAVLVQFMRSAGSCGPVTLAWEGGLCLASAGTAVFLDKAGSAGDSMSATVQYYEVPA